jgi:hypothetical protein
MVWFILHVIIIEWKIIKFEEEFSNLDAIALC